MKIAVFPGSFDPITLGHYDIIERASRLFDKIIIAIGQNSQKKYMFSLEQRKVFIKKTFENFPNVEVDSFGGILPKERGEFYCERAKKSRRF